MKKLAKFSVITACLLAMTAMTAKPAHAYLLVEGAAGETPADGPWSDGPIVAASYVGLCLITLPLCLLNDKTDGHIGVSAADLKANGYSDAQINQIINDQATLGAALHQRDMSLQIRANDTKASLGAQIHSVAPSVSATYVDFLSDAAALK